MTQLLLLLNLGVSGVHGTDSVSIGTCADNL